MSLYSLPRVADSPNIAKDYSYTRFKFWHFLWQKLTCTSKSGAKSRPLYWLAISLGVNDVVAITTSKFFTLIISSSQKSRFFLLTKNFGEILQFLYFSLFLKKKLVFLFFWCSGALRDWWQAIGSTPLWLFLYFCRFFRFWAFFRFFVFFSRLNSLTWWGSVWVSVLVSSFRDTESATLIGRPSSARRRADTERKRETYVGRCAENSFNNFIDHLGGRFATFLSFSGFASLKYCIKIMEIFKDFFQPISGRFYWKFNQKII